MKICDAVGRGGGPKPRLLQDLINGCRQPLETTVETRVAAGGLNKHRFFARRCFERFKRFKHFERYGT